MAGCQYSHILMLNLGGSKNAAREPAACSPRSRYMRPATSCLDWQKIFNKYG